MDLGPVELSIAGAALAVLGGGYRRIWCWYYQLTDANALRIEQVAAMQLQLEKAERRESEWRTIALDQRRLLRTAAKKTASE